MQKREEDSQPLGICHRLFNFVLSRLVGFRLSQRSTEVPVEYTNGGDKKGGSPTVTANGAQLQKGPETVPVKDHGKELPPVRDITIANGKGTSADQLLDKGSPLIKPIYTGKAKHRAGKVRNMPPEEGEVKERPWPSLTLGTNINEKSGDFIRQKKEEMQRTNSMEHKKF